MSINGAFMKQTSVDVDIYIPFVKSLIKKYGNFKISDTLHNTIIRKLAEICEEVEEHIEIYGE